MKLATTKSDGVAIVNNDLLIPIGDIMPKGSTMIDLIEQYDGVKDRLKALAATGKGIKLDAKLLKPPVERPSKIYAAAGNYQRGTGGLDAGRGRGSASTVSPGRAIGEHFLETTVGDRRTGR